MSGRSYLTYCVTVFQEMVSLITENARLAAENARFAAEKERFAAEKTRLAAENEALKKSVDGLTDMLQDKECITCALTKVADLLVTDDTQLSLVGRQVIHRRQLCLSISKLP